LSPLHHQVKQTAGFPLIDTSLGNNFADGNYCEGISFTHFIYWKKNAQKMSDNKSQLGSFGAAILSRQILSQHIWPQYSQIVGLNLKFSTRFSGFDVSEEGLSKTCIYFQMFEAIPSRS